MGSWASLKPLAVASVKQLLHDLDKQNAAGTAVLRAYSIAATTPGTRAATHSLLFEKDPLLIYCMTAAVRSGH